MSDGTVSVLAWRVQRIAQSQYGPQLVVPYGVCIRCAGYQVLHPSGLCWDCTYSARHHPRPRMEREQDVVYYAAKDGLIKIGTTARLYTRMHQLHTRLLGFEPGSYDQERARKHQFTDLRTGPRSEWFRPGPALLEHIRQLPRRPHARVRCRG